MLAALLAAAYMSTEPTFWNAAPTPPMGWNSWDCFATTVTEAQTKAHADAMAEKLKPFGWRYIVVDIQWYEPKAVSFEYRQNAELALDAYGRLLPAENRFPSASGGKGFASLAKYVHDKGLKFGVHLMRGVPRQAVRENLPVEGTPYRAQEIADESSTCPWNPDMFGVDMTKPGAQEYYDGVFAQLARWGVDFVKVDDIARPYHQAEIEAIRKAIDKTRRPMVLSLSPGETRLDVGEHVAHHANMWRISDDFWDHWPALLEQFERCRKWASATGRGRYPDADMLPIGRVRFGQPSNFSHDEQITLMTLWSIFRSPLMLGCDLTKLDDATLALITNPEVLAVDQHGRDAREVSNDGGRIVWTSRADHGGDLYLALFNTTDAEDAVGVDLATLGLTKPVKVRDLWGRCDLGTEAGRIEAVLPAHGAALYRFR